MIWLRRACEWLAAVAVGLATVIAGGVAFARYVYAYTPTWTEPVMILLVLFAVAVAVGPGLQDGAHVSIRFLFDRLTDGARRALQRIIAVATLLLGLAIFVSGSAYSLDLLTMGFTDYAGIPQWVQAALASVFGGLLAIFALAALLNPEGSDGQGRGDRPVE